MTRDMLGERTSRGGDNNEEARATLQARLALFWKVLFILMLIASALGAVGAFNKTLGSDLILDVALAALAGFFWWWSGRGKPSARFSRMLEAGGLLLFF